MELQGLAGVKGIILKLHAVQGLQVRAQSNGEAVRGYVIYQQMSLSWMVMVGI